MNTSPGVAACLFDSAGLVLDAIIEAASGVGGAEHSENSLRGRGRLVPAWSPSLRMTELKIGKLWPDDVCEGIFRDRPCIAGTGVGTPEFAVVLDALQRAVDDGFEF